MATVEKRKEGISRAYVRAIAAAAGANLAVPEDDYGIDLNLREVKVDQRGGKNRHIDGVTLDVQMKCSKDVKLEGEELVFDIEAKTYNDLVDTTVNTPRILVLLKIAEQELEWISQDDDKLEIRHCAYWASLKGKIPTTNTASVRIKIPLSQRFSSEVLKSFFQKINNGVDL